LKKQIKNIVLTGPESSGKTTLARRLAELHGTAWVPEYAREYLENLGRPYEESDLLEIARGQLEREERAKAKAEKFLFCDTGMLVLKVWSEVKYGNCHPWILEQLQSGRYDFFLLCAPDIPWEPDPLRENPDGRHFLYGIYKKELKRLSLPFVEVSGDVEERLSLSNKHLSNTG
jgi:NadR type nicotinamide-nucleotide adenylyltransferase